MLEAPASQQISLVCHEYPSMPHFDDASLKFRSPAPAPRFWVIACSCILTISPYPDDAFAAAESLVLTDFGVCPLVEL